MSAWLADRFKAQADSSWILQARIVPAAMLSAICGIALALALARTPGVDALLHASGAQVA